MSSLTAFFSERISLLSDMLSFLLLNFLQCFYHIILSFIRLLQSCLPLEIAVFRAESQLASNVALKPPDGKEEASGSPLMSSFPEKLISTFPLGWGAEMKESCFSAVTPVSGRNQ